MFFIKELTLRLLQAHILRKFQKLYLKTVIDSPCNVQNSLILASLLTTYFVLLQSVFHWQLLPAYISPVPLTFGAVILCLHILLSIFLWKNFIFISFSLFFVCSFWWSITYLRQNINQSETSTVDKKFTVKLYVQLDFKLPDITFL